MNWLIIVLAVVGIALLFRFAKKGGCCGGKGTSDASSGEKKEGGCCSH